MYIRSQIMHMVRRLIFILVFPAILTAQGLEICRGETGMVGFCNQNGEVVIPQIYYDAFDFVGGYAAVLLEGKWSIINETGETVVGPIFNDLVECSHSDFILARKGDKWQFIYPNGDPVTDEYEVTDAYAEFKFYGAVADFEPDTWFAVSKRDKWGAITMNNEIMVDFKYDWLHIVRREIAGREGVVGMVMKQDDRYGWQRADARAGTGFYFDEYLGENDEYLFFLKGEDVIALNAITGAKASSIEGADFHILKNDTGNQGLIDLKAGKVIVPFEYGIIDLESIENYILFGFGSELGMADYTGAVLLEPSYRDIKLLVDNPMFLSVRNQDNKVAIMRVEGAEVEAITEFKYTFAREEDGSFYVGIGNQHGYVSREGVETWR